MWPQNHGAASPWSRPTHLERFECLQSYIGLAGLWLAILGVSVYSAYSFTPLGKMTNENR